MRDFAQDVGYYIYDTVRFRLVSYGLPVPKLLTPNSAAADFIQWRQNNGGDMTIKDPRFENFVAALARAHGWQPDWD